MAGSLKEYNQKRQFGKTPEPRGTTAPKRAGPLRFVVQHHIASHDHYDLRLEWDGALKSWAVPKGPSYNPRDKRLAVQVEDHPLGYRDFEGTIPKGEYGGGTVMVWDEGSWQPLGDAEKGLADGSLKFTLDGSRLKGKWALVRMKPKPGENGSNWLLIKEKDEFVNIFDVTKLATSVKTGRTMEQIAAGKPPKSKNVGRPPPAAVLKSVALTHPDKVLFTESGITKGDVARYYLRVAPRMLPHLENRLISSVRCPGGIESACFYKKHPAGDIRGVATVPVPGRDGKSEDYYYVADIYGLLGEVQMNTLEFHTWGCHAQTLEQPDMMVFDLDPDEGMELGRVRQGVKDLKSLLDRLELTAYLKTSGGKGYHIVLPFWPASGWDAFHGFAQNIAKAMEATWPDRYTSNARKNKRTGKIFVDWVRNGRGATSVAPYSVRARKGAPVSMPIAWRELDTVAPNGVDMAGAVSRLRRKDPWAGFFEQGQQLK